MGHNILDITCSGYQVLDQNNKLCNIKYIIAGGGHFEDRCWETDHLLELILESDSGNGMYSVNILVICSKLRYEKVRIRKTI